MECYIKDICQLYANNECTGDCYTKNYYERVLNKSNIPLRYIHADKTPLIPDDVDMSAFRFLQNIRENMQDFVSRGRSVYIYSPYYGNGKTTWAIKLAIAYLHTLEEPRKLPVKFVNTQSMITDWKNRFKDELDTTQLFELVNDLKDCDLAIFDDIGITKLTDNDNSLMFSIIDYRLSNNKTCIFTSNNVPSMLINKIDERLADRITGYSHKVGFKKAMSSREEV